MTWMLLTIKLSNILHCPPWFLIDFSIKLSNISNISNISNVSQCPPWFLHCPPCWSWFPPWSHVFLIIICLLTSTSLMFMSSHWFPSWSPCFSHVILLDLMFLMFSSLLILMMIEMIFISHCLPPLSSHVIPMSSLISYVLPVLFMFLMFSALLILMMIVIKSIWWCPPLLSSARWWCFLPVLSLWSDYRGWLLIIFILNILLWWPLFLSF